MILSTTTERQKRDIRELAIAKSMVIPTGFDFDVPADYAKQFKLDVRNTEIMVTQIADWSDIKIQELLGISPLTISFGVYRDHATMVERESRR